MNYVITRLIRCQLPAVKIIKKTKKIQGGVSASFLSSLLNEKLNSDKSNMHTNPQVLQLLLLLFFLTIIIITIIVSLPPPLGSTGKSTPISSYFLKHFTRHVQQILTINPYLFLTHDFFFFLKFKNHIKKNVLL